MMDITLNASIQSSCSSRKCLTKINVEASPVNVLELHQLVHARNGRVELHTHDGDTCVLISKVELEALEHALEILSETDEVRAMREHLTQIAAAATNRPA